VCPADPHQQKVRNAQFMPVSRWERDESGRGPAQRCTLPASSYRYPSISGIREIEAFAMSYRRMWAALPAVALMSVVTLAAGCAASTTSAAPGAPAVSQSGTGQGGTPTPGESAPAASASAQPGSPLPTQAPSGTPTPGESDCSNWPSSVPDGPLPLTFVPVQALRCVQGTTTVPGKGVYASATLERATKDLGILVDALRGPSGHMLPGTICPMLAMVPPQLVLVAGNGAMISPRFPVDDCGMIQPGVLSALAKMPWQVVSVRLLSKLPDVSVTAVPNPSGAIPGGSSGSEKGIPQVAANS
jgi:hypothetical protein